ncbi:MAG: nitroreductase [Fuerstiella sp.]|jgi:nitroreductase|nr:nitroreductase [Fuerstiella sp.]MCP4510781.1 nitroreductase [Fuerstiella sp.]MDG2126896.1 nitroreductase [Fuerstiella sp.]
MPNEDTADTHASPVAVVTKLIESRRSIKPADFSDRRVEDAFVWQMLSNANWAPTHGMTEPWRFFVFADAARLTLGKLLARIYHEVTPPESLKPAKAAKLVSNAERASHLIVIAMKRQASGKIPEVEEIEAVACAVQNLHLTATAIGVAGYWSSGAAICSEQLRQHLGLSGNDRVLGLFYVGYSGTDWPTGTRSSVEEKVVWSSDA